MHDLYLLQMLQEKNELAIFDHYFAYFQYLPRFISQDAICYLMSWDTQISHAPQSPAHAQKFISFGNRFENFIQVISSVP